MYLAQKLQRSEAGEARTRGLSVSSQALYHWATLISWLLKSQLIQFYSDFKTVHIYVQQGILLNCHDYGIKKLKGTILHF